MIFLKQINRKLSFTPIILCFVYSIRSEKIEKWFYPFLLLKILMTRDYKGSQLSSGRFRFKGWENQKERTLKKKVYSTNISLIWRRQ